MFGCMAVAVSAGDTGTFNRKYNNRVDDTLINKWLIINIDFNEYNTVIQS